MRRTVLLFCIFSVLLKHVEAACFAERVTGPNCVYKGIIIPPGQSYEKTTGPGCYKCDCENNGDLVLSCCDVGKIAVSYPKDICRVVQRGCDLLAVSKFSDYRPCRGDVAYIAG